MICDAARVVALGVGALGRADCLASAAGVVTSLVGKGGLDLGLDCENEEQATVIDRLNAAEITNRPIHFRQRRSCLAVIG